MSFLPTLISAGIGLLTQHQNANTLGGNLSNGAMNLLNTQNEADTTALYAENMRHQSAMQWESSWFNEMMDEKSEKMREMNSLRDLDMEERKADNQITKKFINSINE